MKQTRQIPNWPFVLLCSTLLFPLFFSAQTSCTNSDFEQSTVADVTASTQIAGWTINRSGSSTANGEDNCNMIACCPFDPLFSKIINTSGGFVDPMIGSIYPLYSVFGPGQNPAALNYNPQLPGMGGDKILCLNNFTSVSVFSEQATKSIFVTPSNNILKVAYSIVLVPYHLCCDGSGFRMAINTTTCLLVNTNACASNSLAGFYNGTTGTPATATSTLIFSRWKVRVIDLTPYMGQLVTLSVTASRCNYGAHAGYAYLDAECGTSLLHLNGVPLPSTLSVASASTCLGNFTLAAEPFYESYLWTGPNGFQSANPAIVTNQPGTYTIQLTQESCDPIIRQVTITQPDPLTVAASGTSCAGQNVVLTASGAATYTWMQPGAHSPTIQVHPEVSTVYYVNGTMDNGCALSGSFAVDPKPLPAPAVAGPSKLCSGATATFAASGAYSYEWFSSSGYYGNTPYALFSTGLGSGPVTFTLSGTSIEGCKASVPFSLEILPLPHPSVTILPSDSVCPGTLVTLQGSGASYYGWTGPGIIQGQGSGQSFVFKAEQFSHSGTYVLRGTDLQGCSKDTSLSLYVIPPPSAVISGNRDGCEPFCTELTAVTAAGLQIEKNWKLNDKVSAGNTLKPCPLPAGVHVIDLVLKDLQTTCTSASTTQVNVYPLPVADFTTSPESPSEFMEEIELVNTSKGENISYVKWFVTSDLKLESDSRSLVRVSKAGTFPVALCIRNEWGCEDTIVKPLVIAEEPLMYIPDAFTPNGDGINDIFKPVTNGPVTYSFMIFDRWGKKIFETDQNGPGWDGRLKGAICQDGVYTCLVLVKDQKLGERKLERRVSLLR